MTPEERDRMNDIWPLCCVSNMIFLTHDFDLNGTCQRCRNTAEKFAYNYRKSERNAAEGSRK